MRRIISILTVLILLAFMPTASVRAEDIYYEQYAESGAGELENALDGETRAFLSENGIDIADSSWTKGITAENVFSHIFGFLRQGAKGPIACGGAIIGIIIIFAAASCLDTQEKYTAAALFSCIAATATVMAGSVWQSVTAAASAVKAGSTFMLALVPIFASVTAASGATATAAAMSGVLLTAAECVSAVASFGVLPVAGGCLAISICGELSPLGGYKLAAALKKLSLWVLSLASTVFLGVLGIQTVIGSASDNVALKTAKFIVGTTVPVAGPALSEAASAVTSSVLLLRSSIGIYGVVALCALLLPITAELLIWRAVMNVCALFSDVLSAGRISSLLRAVDGMLSILLGALAITAAMFIISLAVVTTAGRAV